MNELSKFALMVAAFVVLGCVALGAAMVREIKHYRRLKERHAQNVKRLAAQLPMSRTAIAVDVARKAVKNEEIEANRCLCVALIGYVSRLEKELKSAAPFAVNCPSSVTEVLESAPPILELTTAIREREWGEFYEILRGIPRASRRREGES